MSRFRWVRIAGGLVLLAILGASLGGIIAYRSYANDLVPPDELAVAKPIVGAKVLDRNGQLLYEYIDADAGVRRPVSLDQISPHFLAATIVTEDASFYSNPGLNVRGIARAAWENLNPFGKPLGGSGGSSITQQLVKNLYIPAEDRQDRSLERKVKEAIYALELTRRYSKDQILAWYVNHISYGGLYLGVEAASQGYFGKPASELTLAESALLAGLPQAPSLYDPNSNPDGAIARRTEVLNLLAKKQTVRIGAGVDYVVDADGIAAAAQDPLVLVPRQIPVEAPHFVFTYVQPELLARFGRDGLLHDGLTITTSLDLELQRRAEAVLETWLSEYEAASNTHNGAVIVLDPRTGEILVMVGSRDYFRDDIAGRNNNLLAVNSPGSAFKPFVYLDAFLKFNAGPATLIYDSPVRYVEANGTVFEPRNPSGASYGTITLRRALGSSLNVPAFRLAQALGAPDIVSHAKRLGFTDLNGSYGPSIAIGGVDLKAIDLAYGYAVLANGGVMKGQRPASEYAPDERDSEPVGILKVTTQNGEVVFETASEYLEQRVVPEEHAFFVNSILSDPGATCLTFGCGGLAVPGYSVAVKTGTSEPFDPRGPAAGKIGETWAFGYTPDVVVGVWAGNADNAPITNIFSTTIAFQAMRDILLDFYSGRPSTPFVPPPGVIRKRVCYTSPIRTCVEDFFLRSGSSASIVQATPPAPAPQTGPQKPPARPQKPGKKKR